MGWINKKFPEIKSLMDFGGRLGLALVFFWSGAAKLFSPVQFASTISDFGLLPDQITIVAALVISALEVLLAIGLLTNIRGAVAMAAGAIVFFIIIIGYGMFIGLDIDCGCFGPGNPESSPHGELHSALLRDLALLALSLFIMANRAVENGKLKPVINFFSKQPRY